MTDYEHARFENHEEMWELLPWYVNGSLDDDEKRLIERHAQVCITCRSELNEQRRVREDVRRVDVEILVARGAFRELDERIHRSRAQTELPRGVLDATRLWFTDIGGAARAWSAAAVSTAAVVAAAFVWAPGRDDGSVTVTGGEYRTLTSASSASSVGAQDVRIVFSDRLTFDEVRNTLAPLDAEIVEGPSGQGVFRVRIGDENTGFREIVAVISTLRANHNVIFAEPAFAMPALDDRQ